MWEHFLQNFSYIGRSFDHFAYLAREAEIPKTFFWSDSLEYEILIKINRFPLKNTQNLGFYRTFSEKSQNITYSKIPMFDRKKKQYSKKKFFFKYTVFT